MNFSKNKKSNFSGQVLQKMNHVAELSTKNTHWQIGSSKEPFYQLTRRDVVQQERVIVDAFGPTWIFGWVLSSSSQIFIRSQKKWIRINSNQIIFIPPFSVIQWRLEPSTVHWQCYASTLRLPQGVPTDSCLYDSDCKTRPKTPEEVFLWLRNQKPVHTIIQEQKNSKLAQKVKKHLDTYFCADEKIQDLANLLQISREALCRSFASTYGLSPLSYRQKVRIFFTLNLINQGVPVTHALFEGGFTCVSEFNRQLRNFLDIAPSSLSARALKQT